MSMNDSGGGVIVIVQYSFVAGLQSNWSFILIVATSQWLFFIHGDYMLCGLLA